MLQGVYLFLGYSRKDEGLLKKVTNQGALEAIGAIQGLVSYHNVNSNKVWTELSLRFSPYHSHELIQASVVSITKFLEYRASTTASFRVFLSTNITEH